MKVKIMLLLVATMGSAALVASAQQAPYVITSDIRGEPDETARNNLFIARRQGQDLRSNPAPPGGSFSTTTVYGLGHPTLWNPPGEDSGLSHHAQQLAEKLASAKSDGDREKIKSQLAETLEKQFDQRQKRHEEEIKSLEAQIKKLKDLVDKRQENRREIVSARLNQIVKESQGLGW
jgi:hypothetical protein